MTVTINHDNYFEVAEAIHCYCSLNHSGQASEQYSILSRSQFKPSPTWTETRCEIENEFYSEINDENVSELFEELEKFLGSLL